MLPQTLLLAPLLLTYPTTTSVSQDHAASDSQTVTEDHVAAKPSTAPYSAEKDLRLELATGMFKAGQDQGGFILNGALLRRIGILQFGVDATYGDAVLGYEYEQAAAAGGVVWQTPIGLRLDALGEFGGTYYRHVGTELLSTNPGAYGLVPTARARVGLSYVVGPHWPSHFDVGLWAFAEDDLTRVDKSVTYDENGFFGSGQSVTKSERLGTTRGGVLLSIGGVFGI